MHSVLKFQVNRACFNSVVGGAYFGGKWNKKKKKESERMEYPQ